MSQQDVSDVERGHLEHVRLATIRRLAAALDAKASIDLGWRGGMLDRLIDERHAALVEAVSEVLLANGWQVRPEVSFALFGERGSIDILAWHPATSERPDHRGEDRTDIGRGDAAPVRRQDPRRSDGHSRNHGSEPASIGAVLGAARGLDGASPRGGSLRSRSGRGSRRTVVRSGGGSGNRLARSPQSGSCQGYSRLVISGPDHRRTAFEGRNSHQNRRPESRWGQPEPFWAGLPLITNQSND